jgi:Ni,Fe-hydrogenase maturation factor
MRGGGRDVVLYAITIDPHQPISMNMSPQAAKAAEEAVLRILAELNAGFAATESAEKDAIS